jgi:UTP--glucose-1-phosphate uridylyltransferase
MAAVEGFAPIEEKMAAAGLARKAIDTFQHHYAALRAGASGQWGGTDIQAVRSLPDAEHLERFAETGTRKLSSTVVIKLNGGLGTSMGLTKAKSLLPVRDGLTFLDLIARQILSLREQSQAAIPALLMNSFRTRDESLETLARYEGLALPDLPLDFLQNKAPKIRQSDLAPSEAPSDPGLEWCPPGHGDLYTALSTSGTLTLLMDRGIEYAFVSNADNLGAVLDPGLLGYMVENDIDFMMEAADRTSADRKGGHLCIRRGQGLALRESAQCPDDEKDDFQDVNKYKYFNTNNLWVHVPSLAALMDHHGGILPLQTIVNRKTLDPRDPDSEPVFQLETAMGSAISLFPNAAAVRVPRSRFSPVKTTSDLLGVQSDAYQLTEDSRIVLDPSRESPPTIILDSAHYKLVDEFSRRFPGGAPSLIECDSLEVTGDITFGSGVVVRGPSRVAANGAPARVPDDTVISGSFTAVPMSGRGG